MGPVRIACLVFLLLPLAADLAGQAIVGRLVGEETSEPIPGATLTLLDAEGEPGEERAGALTDSTGAFRFLRVARGSYRLRIARIGYEPLVTGSFELRARDSLELEVRMAEAAVPLAPVTVTVHGTALRASWLERRGFHQRQKTLSGTFMTRAEIERRQPRHLIDMFRQTRGFRLEPAPRGVGYVLTVSRGGTAGKCRPHVYVDGIHMQQYAGDWVDVLYGISPEHVEAIEAYPGRASVPAEFSGFGSACAAVLIWTR